MIKKSASRDFIIVIRQQHGRQLALESHGRRRRRRQQHLLLLLFQANDNARQVPALERRAAAAAAAAATARIKHNSGKGRIASVDCMRLTSRRRRRHHQMDSERGAAIKERPMRLQPLQLVTTASASVAKVEGNPISSLLPPPPLSGTREGYAEVRFGSVRLEVRA